MGNELSAATYGAVLGVAISVPIQALVRDGEVTLPVVALGAALALFAASRIGPLNWILRPSPSARVDGEWLGTWSYVKDDDGLVTISEHLSIRQIGQFIRGTSKSTNVTGPFPHGDASYAFAGRIHGDGRFEARWRSSSRGRRYEGVLLGQLAPSGLSARVSWLGNEDGGYRDGRAEWQRHGRQGGR